MKHKVSELEGALLDAAVAKAEGWTWVFDSYEDDLDGTIQWVRTNRNAGPMRRDADGEEFTPSEEWSHGGPIIERERPALDPCWPSGGWYARSQHRPCDGDQFYGETALIAAMRAYVASKFGKEIDI